MRELELKGLKEFLELDEGDLEKARREAEGTFAWNVALEDPELAGWTLVSDQFVQVGDDQQLSTGLWEDEAGLVVRTDVQAYRDASAGVAALVAKLAAIQTGTYLRDDPEAWTGLRFVSETGTSVVCLAGNLLVSLMLVEGGEANLVALSDELVESILGDVAETEEEAAAPAARRARVGVATPLDMPVVGPPGKPGGEEDLSSILTPPPDTRAAWPVTRTDRPTRVVVRSGGGEVFMRDGGLRGLARAAGDTEVAVTLKPPGAAKRRRVRLSVKVDENRYGMEER